MRDAVRPLHTLVWLGVLAGLGWTAARVAIPALTGQAIDEGIVPGNFEVALEWTGIILAVGVMQAICTGLRRYAAFRLAYRVETDLRMRLVAHLQRLHFAFHDHAQTGQLMANANTDIQQIQQVVLLIPLTIASVLTMVAVVVVLVLRSPGLALFALATLPLLNIAATRFTRRMYPVGLSLQQELADLSGVVEESVAGVRVVKGFGAERLQERNLAVEADDVYERSIDQARLRANFLPLIDLLPTLGLVGILWYGGHQVLEGNLSIGDIVEANFYVLMLIWPLRMVGMLLGQLSRAAASAGRIHTVLGHRARDRGRPGRRGRFPTGRARSGSTGSPSATGGSGPCSTTSTSRFAGGEAIALVGATASGKTHRRPARSRASTTSTGGRVCIDGRTSASRVWSTSGVPSASCSRTRSCSPTRCAATSRSPIPKRRWNRSCARGTARRRRRVRARSCPTVTTRSSASTATRSRVANVSASRSRRAVLADPRILILDDATSSVDPSKEHEIRSALREVMRGRTTIIIAHRPATIALADRVVLLDEREGRRRRHARRSARDERRATAKCSRARKPRSCERATTKATTKTCRPSARGDVMRGGGGWSDAVPEESLSRADAERVVRRLVRMLRPYRARIAVHRRSCCSPQVGTLLAGPALVRYGIDHGIGRPRRGRVEHRGRAVPGDGVRRACSSAGSRSCSSRASAKRSSASCASGCSTT